MSKEMESLQRQKLILIAKTEEQSSFIEILVAECLPIASEIAAAKGWFKVFKIVKIAIHLSKLLIDFFDKKPEPIDFNNF